ncbi:MAG: Na+/H+ antiporter subunit E [Defluviitaleaceae bacterium]|nr:Na+/H+ antiporter subunit E [Defluviitaleaceae bacterium]
MALAVIWVVLTETLSWESVAVAMIIAVFAVHFSDKFLPSANKEAGTVKFSKLIFYPFYLIGQVYLAGFSMLKFVIVGAKFEFVPVKTTLKSEPLKVLLMDSMTLVPGSVSVDIKDDIITSLWIFDKKLNLDQMGKEAVSEMAKGNLEKKIKKAETIENAE